MDLEETPWADTAPITSPTSAAAAESQSQSQSQSRPRPDHHDSSSDLFPSSASAAQPAPGSGSAMSASRLGPRTTAPRRFVAQSTRLETLDDDPLGPLGPLGATTPDPAGTPPSFDPMHVGAAGGGDGMQPPAPPQKERVIARTTMPPSPLQTQPRRDPHHIDDDDDGEDANNLAEGQAGDGEGPAAGRRPRVPPPVQAALPSPVRSTVSPSVSIEQAAKPTFHITVGDPAKVGDITSSHIVYSVRTKTTSKAYRQPEFEVRRRYRDFLWLYNQLHANCPGVVVPPPPDKQAVGRFETNFVESRRAALEKMLNKTAAHPTLQHDPDVKLFLESEAFNVDVRHKDRVGPNLGPEHKGVLGSLGLGLAVGAATKFVEQDDWFHDRKIYLDALESQLRALLRTMETMVQQRRAMADAANDFSASLHALSTVELAPSLTGPLDALSELQLTIRDVYDRQAHQDVLTLGIVMEEYIRLVGSAKQAFGQRQKAFHAWHAAEAELAKRRATQDRLLRQGKSQQDRISQMGADVADAERKVHQARLLFEDMGRLMRVELDRFEREKVEDFKSGVETFLESAVEAQKELIEKWETFLMQLDAEDDETVFYRPPVYESAKKPAGNTAVDRARARIHEDSD